VTAPSRRLSAPTDDELPPLDDDDADGADDSDIVITPLVEEEPPPEFDDESPTDPSFDIDFPSDVENGDAEAKEELPIGPILPRGEDEEEPPGDDAVGFDDARDRHDLIGETNDSAANDVGDGFDDRSTHVDEHELPALDGDDGPELDIAHFRSAPGIADEAELPRAEMSWRIDFIAPDREHCSALAAAGGVVVAGSSDLFWLDEGRETVVRMGLDGNRISSVALVGDDYGTALCVTAFGRLLRRSRASGDVERLVEWRRAAEASGSSAEGLELRSLAPDRPSSVLGRLTSGRLVRSDDRGSTFRPVEADITTLTVSTSGDPVAVLTRDGTRLGLSTDGGASFDLAPLDTPAREIASGEAPLVAASGSSVALGDAERGVAVSADGGKTFRLVSGTTNVTALAAGTRGGRHMAFAALYRETEDRSLLVLIDAETAVATAVAVLALPAPDEPDVALELGRIERLVWDGRRLWAAGAFGLARISA
jgi:hypothetical protein